MEWNSVLLIERLLEDKMIDHSLTLLVLQEVFAICRLEKHSPIPDWALVRDFYSITRTQDELSIVCPQVNVPEGIACDNGWRCLKVDGSLDFSLTGIIASLATTLARAEISIAAVSTYDTDYLMVKGKDLERTVLVLSQAGHEVHQE
jgi:hypothetical protein